MPIYQLDEVKLAIIAKRRTIFFLKRCSKLGNSVPSPEMVLNIITANPNMHFSHFDQRSESPKNY